MHIADVNRADNNGLIPLHYAAIYGHEKTVKFLARRSTAIIDSTIEVGGSSQTPTDLLLNQLPPDLLEGWLDLNLDDHPELMTQRHPDLAHWLDKICAFCGKRGRNRCARCRKRYCCRDCQIADWHSGHKVACLQERQKQKQEQE
jgi:hypothetical protein